MPICGVNTELLWMLLISYILLYIAHQPISTKASYMHFLNFKCLFKPLNSIFSKVWKTHLAPFTCDPTICAFRVMNHHQKSLAESSLKVETYRKSAKSSQSQKEWCKKNSTKLQFHFHKITISFHKITISVNFNTENFYAFKRLRIIRSRL